MAPFEKGGVAISVKWKNISYNNEMRNTDTYLKKKILLHENVSHLVSNEAKLSSS